jgi:hypothetical protein
LILLISASLVARITGMSYWPQLVIVFENILTLT